MNFLPWMIFGIVAGVMATLLETNPKDRGLLGAIILGILGSMTGGMLADLLLSQEVGGVASLTTIVALGGGLGLLFIGRLFKDAPSG
jgi:uncharacterized membrane protein YeaQ/YmgE (transglycosylase-associated protein family)